MLSAQKQVTFLLVYVAMVTYAADLNCFKAGYVKDKRSSGTIPLPTDWTDLKKIEWPYLENPSDLCVQRVGGSKVFSEHLKSLPFSNEVYGFLDGTLVLLISSGWMQTFYNIFRIE